MGEFCSRSTDCGGKVGQFTLQLKMVSWQAPQMWVNKVWGYSGPWFYLGTLLLLENTIANLGLFEVSKSSAQASVVGGGGQ